MWTEDKLSYEGKYYKIKNAVCEPKIQTRRCKEGGLCEESHSRYAGGAHEENPLL